MRIAVISDIHGNLRALEAVLARIRALGDIDRLVVAGDLLSGSSRAVRDTPDVLMSLQAAVIRGNHERQLLACAEAPGGESDQYAFEHTTAAQRAWLGTLPATLELAADVLVCHGTPETDLVYLCEELDGGPVMLASDSVIAGRLGGARQALVLSGHSHHPRTVRLSTGQLVVNAGSVGLQAFTAEHAPPSPRRERIAARALRRLRADAARLAGRASPGRLRLGRGGRDRSTTRSAGLGAVASLRSGLSATA